MDVIRTSYTTKMRTATDVNPVTVRWYFTPPGAPAFTEPSVFRSRVWRDVEDFANTGMGEQTEACFGRKVIEWANGQPPPGLLTGPHPCGSDEVARTGAGPGDPVFTTRIDGGAPCCIGPYAFAAAFQYLHGMDGSFHGQGQVPPDGVFGLWSFIGSPFPITGGFSGTGGSWQLVSLFLPGGQITFVVGGVYPAYSVSMVFPVAMDHSEIEVWGVRYLRARYKATGGSMTTIFLTWPDA